MRYYYSFALFIVLSCKTNKSVLVESKPIKEVSCILNNLPKTIGHESNMESYTSIYKDTIFEIESLKYRMDKYTTIIQLNNFERFVWLLKENEQGIDTVLIHCLTPSKSIDSNFNLEDCEIEIDITEFDDDGNPVVSKSHTVKISSERIK